MNLDTHWEENVCCISKLDVKCGDQNAYQLSQQFLLFAQYVSKLRLNTRCICIIFVYINIYEDKQIRQLVNYELLHETEWWANFIYE